MPCAHKAEFWRGTYFVNLFERAVDFCLQFSHTFGHVWGLSRGGWVSGVSLAGVVAVS